MMVLIFRFSPLTFRYESGAVRRPFIHKRQINCTYVLYITSERKKMRIARGKERANKETIHHWVDINSYAHNNNNSNGVTEHYCNM